MLPDFWPEIYQPWLSVQEKLPQVLRWKKYYLAGSTRQQDSLQHTGSLVLLGIIALARLRPYVELDEGLVLSALAIHDFGEGEIGHDTVYIDKSLAGDLAEYQAFGDVFEPLGEPAFQSVHRAFLLQFAAKETDSLPADAQGIIEQLRQEAPLEFAAFEAIERWDYLLYAFEQYRDRGNEVILVQTLRHQLPHLERIAGILPGFRETIWPDRIAGWFRGFVDEHAGQYIEMPSLAPVGAK